MLQRKERETKALCSSSGELPPFLDFELGSNMTRNWFSLNPGVLCNSQLESQSGNDVFSTPEWTFPEQCRWSLSKNSEKSASKYPILESWATELAAMETCDRINLESFFRDVLRIWNVSYSEVQAALDHLETFAKEEAALEASVILKVTETYSQLSELAKEADGPALEFIR